MIRVAVLGLIRAMLVTVWLLISTAVMLLIIGAMLVRAMKVVPQEDDVTSAFMKLYNVVVNKMGKSGIGVPF